MRHAALVGALVSTCAFSASTGRADDSYWARRSSDMVENAHRIDVTMHDGFAKLVVKRTVFNGGERNDEANFNIALPDGAVAVSLSTLAQKDGKPHWYGGELMEAEAAAAKYLELTGIGGAYPKDPALLSWRGQRLLRLQVFPCPPDAKKSVAYTLLVPTEYTGGQHVLDLPAMGTGNIDTKLRLAARGGTLSVDGKPAVRNARVNLTKRDGVMLALTPNRQPLLGGKLATVQVGKKHLNRLRVEAAAKLSKRPVKARVVIAIDVSRTMTDDQIEASRHAALAYLNHLPDAQVEVLTFARKVTRLVGKLGSQGDAVAALKTAKLERHNGSFVDGALSLADDLLKKKRGDKRPARILLFTDTETRMALDEAHLRAILGGHALLHIVDPTHDAAPRLQRDDHHDWAEIARSTGGLYWTARATAGHADNQRTFEELVRPIRIDKLGLATNDGTNDGCWESELVEGEGLECSDVYKHGAKWAAVTGVLWNTPIRARITPDKTESKRWTSLVFGDRDLWELTEDEMMGLAMRGKAVSPVTSYLAIEPGVRPSTDGLAHGRLGRRHRSRPPRIRAGHAMVTGRRAPFDPDGYLTHAVAAAWLTCGGGGKNAEVKMETNFDEIADVHSVTGDGTAKQLACLQELVWAEVLPKRFEWDHRMWTVDI